jgi:hypothetical protein
MFWSIVTKGADMGPGTGWFHPGQTRLGWAEVAAALDADKDGKITPAEWRGPAAGFARADRDGNGSITAEDLDWTPRSPYMMNVMMSRQRFGQLDGNSNGKVSREEFLRLFEQAAKGKDHLVPEDLVALFATAPPGGRRPGAGGPPGGAPPSGGPGNAAAANAAGRPGSPRGAAPQGPRGAGAEGPPSRLVLLKGLFSGEIGSPYEGPSIGQEAPDFLLASADGKDQVRLSAFRGQKPVVLIFGSFT